jgi:hypothetical protein
LIDRRLIFVMVGVVAGRMLSFRRHQAHVPVHGTVAEVPETDMVVKMAEADCCDGEAWEEGCDGEG